MLYTFTIKGTLPGLNEYLKAERSFHNRHSTGNDMKQQYQMIISNAIRLNLKRTHINNPVRIKYTFYEHNRKRDLDNIAGVAHKFIFGRSEYFVGTLNPDAPTLPIYSEYINHASIQGVTRH